MSKSAPGNGRACRVAAAGLAFALSVGLAAEASAACIPRTGRRGSFPTHGDDDIPSNARFLFEIASWPAQPTVRFRLQYGDTDLPGEFRYVDAVGPVGHPHSQYLYQFMPAGGIPGTDLPYHYFLTYRLAGGTKDEEHSAVFTVKQGSDTSPPDFTGVIDVSVIHGSPDQNAADSGYDCILDVGTFVIATVKFPRSEIKPIGPMKERRDGVVFSAYQASEGGPVGKLLSRSTVWPAEYTNVPAEWKFVVEKDPQPDTKLCYVVRASDAVGNEDTNTNVKCLVAPGPASLPPGAGAPGFFGKPNPPVCAYGQTGGLTGAGILLSGALFVLAGRGRSQR